ncbi:MAG: hypothetical protein IT438_14480 [Phycisphaerales bacterium]|nr:hypothetical protein [Phycisphaerales bacterium]
MRWQRMTRAALVICVGAAVSACCGTRVPDKGKDGPARVSGGQPRKITLDLDPNANLLAKAMASAYKTGGTPFEGALKLRPTVCDPTNGEVADTALDFNLTVPIGEMCVFQALMTKGSEGNIVPADGIPYCTDNEPVFELTKGAVVVSGTRPVAKGRRGRAGAPGTWWAIEIDPSTQVEYFYLLSQENTHEITVKTTKTSGGIEEKPLKYATSPNDYLEVAVDGTITPKALAGDRLAARDKFRAMAETCKPPESFIDKAVIQKYVELLLEQANLEKVR